MIENMLLSSSSSSPLGTSLRTDVALVKSLKLVCLNTSRDDDAPLFIRCNPMDGLI